MREGVGKEAKTPKQKQVRRNRWIAIASGVLLTGFFLTLAFFGLQYFRDSAYQDERAFRVLGHIVGQFGNLQDAIAGAVQLGIVDKNCEPIRSYVGRLALRGDVKFTKLSGPAEGKSVSVGLRDLPRQPFHINQKTAGLTFSVVGYRGASLDCEVQLSGPLRDQIPVFISQTLFDQVVIATQNGDVLARLPRGPDQSQQVQLHNIPAIDLFGGNVSTLLRQAAQDEQSSDGENKDEQGNVAGDGAPGTSTVYSHEIGGQAFRIFVLPFEPAVETYVGGVRSPRLYLVGLTRQSVLASMSEALGSGGALVVTLGVLLCVLLWPFMSLRFASPQEAIGRAQMIALLLALLLIPAVVATTAFSLWTRHRLMLWAEQHAEMYAYRVEQALVQEMDWGLHVLEVLADQVSNNPIFVARKFVMPPTEDGRSAACVPPHACPNVLEIPALDGVPKGWSPIRSAAPLNAQGKSAGLTLSFFRGQPPGDELDLRDREYYLAIRDGDEWQTGGLWKESGPGVEHRFIAQRLFNRSDAARALQLAVPIDIDGNRKGLFTGDTRAYALSATLRSPLLRFAIFDHRNGALIFHTHDERSLAENLLVETEENAALTKSMQKRASNWSQLRIRLGDHFSGRYMGSAHRLYHRAIPGTPWGLVVLYETDAINTIVLQTAIATLATYFAIVASIALMLGVSMILLRQRVDLRLLRAIWPKWHSAKHYQMIRLVGLGLLALLAIAAVSKLNLVLDWPLGILALAVVACVGYAVVVRTMPRFASEAKRKRGPSFVTYKRSYVQSTFVVLCLISSVPTVWIAIGYHDTSIHAFIRDELMNAALDEEQRRRIMLRDDRRFNDITEVNHKRAEDLSRALPVPGYRFEPGGQDSWLLTDALPAPWLFKCGPPVLDLYRRWLWILSTTRQVQRPIASNARSLGDETLERPASTTTTQKPNVQEANECPELAVRARRRSDDGTRVLIALPLSSHSADIKPIGLCPRGEIPQVLCHDEEMHSLYRGSSALMLAAIMLGSALVLLLLSAHAARRLFGVRIPFAGRFVPSSADEASAAALLDAEMELVRLKNTEGLQLTSKDEADWRASRCEPIYRQMWEGLDQAQDQQLLLLHLAHGRYANPENQLVIEQLLQRGYITLAPWPRIIEPGFAEFIRRVHPSDALDELRYEASHTPWSQWRTPVLIVVIIIAAMLMWLAGSAMHILMGVVGGVATLFGSITQVTSFIHREKPKA